MRLRPVLLALFALFLTACQVDAAVDVVVTEDGSGTVTVTLAFDDEVIDAAPELLDGLRTSDLAAAGWGIEGPTASESGQSVTIIATKGFSSPDHLAGVLGEIAGDTGVFNDFAVTRERSFARTTYTLTGQIDASVNIERFSDEGITGLLGSPIGRSVDELESLAGRPLEQTVTLRFTVTLPDTAESVGGQVDGNTAAWAVLPVDPLPTDIDVTSSVEDRLPRIYAAIALIAIALLVTLLVFRVLARLGGRRAESRASDEAVQMRRPDRPSTSEPQTATTPRSRPPRLELVVLDARGVLYDEANDIGARLVPFVRERGSRASLQEINDVTRAASLGRLSTAELWTNLGVEGDYFDLDAEYTSEFTLREGVLEFIDRLHDRGLRVAVITNNVLGWSTALRRRFQLDAHVDTWVISGEIGSRKPDAAFFEALRRMTGVEFADSLLIDDQIDHLDMARSLGMSTAMFVPAGAQLPASSPHPIVHGFESFFGRRSAE